MAANATGTYLAAQYRRMAARRGKKRALMALGHTSLVLVYDVLARKQPDHDVGTAYFDHLAQHRSQQRLVPR